MKINEAFSLVELLVVMSIIAILLAIASFGMQIMTRNGRNAKRIDFVNDIKIGVEQFYIQNGRYPTQNELRNAFNTGAKEFRLDLGRIEPYVVKYNDTILDPTSDTTPGGTKYCYNSQRGVYVLGIIKEGGTDEWQDIGNDPERRCGDDPANILAISDSTIDTKKVPQATKVTQNTPIPQATKLPQNTPIPQVTKPIGNQPDPAYPGIM